MASDTAPSLAIAKLSRALGQKQIEDIWRTEQALIPGELPYLEFQVQGEEVRITVSPKHTLGVSTDEIKRPFQIAIHRKYPTMKIEWLDGPMPPLRLH